jgi:hypothetical protein
VVGRICTFTFAGISLAEEGRSATRIEAWSFSSEIELRQLQAGPVGLDRDHRRRLERLLVDRDREPDEQGDHRDEPDAGDEQPAVLPRVVVVDVDEHPAPATR